MGSGRRLHSFPGVSWSSILLIDLASLSYHILTTIIRTKLCHELTGFYLCPFPRRKQYSSFRVAPSVSVDGNVTLGENIADQGGLRIAEIAYEKWLEVQIDLNTSSR